MSLNETRSYLLIVTVFLLSGCARVHEHHDGRLRVVATTTQLADFARQIGGSRVDVTQILKPNTDPHDYEPRPKDVVRTADAQVILRSGKHLDDWMAHVIEESGTHAPVLVAGAPIADANPHWWHDPRAAAGAVTRIAAALAAADPAGAATFSTRGRAYRAQVLRLDRSLANCLARVPDAERKLVTDHDAFGPFARRYGLTVVGTVIASQTTEAQPSAGAVAALVRTIRREHVKAVFPETTVNKALARTIAQQTGAQIGGALYGDTLGPKGSTGATYLQMERANADTIVRGLTAGAIRCR